MVWILSFVATSVASTERAAYHIKSFITEHRWFSFGLFNLLVLSGKFEYFIPADLLGCFVLQDLAITRRRRMKENTEGVCRSVVIIYGTSAG